MGSQHEAFRTWSPLNTCSISARVAQRGVGKSSKLSSGSARCDMIAADLFCGPSIRAYLGERRGFQSIRQDRLSELPVRNDSGAIQSLGRDELVVLLLDNDDLIVGYSKLEHCHFVIFHELGGYRAGSQPWKALFAPR